MTGKNQSGCKALGITVFRGQYELHDHGYCGGMHETPAIHRIVTPVIGIGSIGFAAIVSAVIRMVHLVLVRLTFSHVQLAETGIQGLDADRKNQEQDQYFHRQ
jgi:hypothetical protein